MNKIEVLAWLINNEENANEIFFIPIKLVKFFFLTFIQHVCVYICYCDNACKVDPTGSNGNS